MAEASEFEGLNADYYLLLTSADPDKWGSGETLMSTSRYLGRSTEAVKKRFGVLDELNRLSYDAPGAWRQALLRELNHAGVPHDAAALFRTR